MVAAVFQMAFLVCMEIKNNEACLELSNECAKLLHHVYRNHAELASNQTLEPALQVG